jgi:hypothetical protein
MARRTTPSRRSFALVGGGHCAAVSSCVAAHLAYLQLGIGRRRSDRAAQTHVATAHAVEVVGARAVFADCDPRRATSTRHGLRHWSRRGPGDRTGPLPRRSAQHGRHPGDREPARAEGDRGLRSRRRHALRAARRPVRRRRLLLLLPVKHLDGRRRCSSRHLDLTAREEAAASASIARLPSGRFPACTTCRRWASTIA